MNARNQNNLETPKRYNNVSKDNRSLPQLRRIDSKEGYRQGGSLYCLSF